MTDSVYDMTVTVRIPTTLRPLSGGVSTVQVEGVTLADVLKGLNDAHPGFAERLFDATGNLHKFVNVFVSIDCFKKSIESSFLQVHSLELKLFNRISRIGEKCLSDELSGL